VADPTSVLTGLSQITQIEGYEFKIEIYRLEDELTWALEMVDSEDGTSTVWDTQFETNQAALDEALNTISKSGLTAFKDNINVIPFPRN
jgi:hypothetical protein